MKGGSEGGYEGSGGGYEAGDWLIITTVQGQLAEDCQCVPTFLSFVRTTRPTLSNHHYIPA